MKKALIGVIVFLSMTTFASAKNKKKVVNCTKQATALSLSGKFADWNLPLQADKSSGYYYGLTNDKQNLYIEVKIKDPTLMRKAIAFGFNVWIDPDGKGKQVLGIDYPQSRMKEILSHHKPKGDRMGGQQSQKQLSYAEMKKRRQEMIQKFNLRYLTGQETGKLINFEKEGFNNVFFGPGDINAIVQMNEKGEIIYEAVIPLKSIFKKTASYLSKGKVFSLVLETGSYTPKSTASEMYGADGENPRMMGGEYGYGGMGEGMGGEGGMMRQWGGRYMGTIEPVRLKLKRVILFQTK